MRLRMRMPPHTSQPLLPVHCPSSPTRTPPHPTRLSRVRRHVRGDLQQALHAPVHRGSQGRQVRRSAALERAGRARGLAAGVRVPGPPRRRRRWLPAAGRDAAADGGAQAAGAAGGRRRRGGGSQPGWAEPDAQHAGGRGRARGGCGVEEGRGTDAVAAGLRAEALGGFVRHLYGTSGMASRPAAPSHNDGRASDPPPRAARPSGCLHAFAWP